MADQIIQCFGDLAETPSPVRVTLKPSTRQNVLASVSVELETELGVIHIHDGRILKNKAGACWFSLPTFSITVSKSYEYRPSVELPATLHRQVSNAALAEFERCEKRGQ